ncbi:MAG: hypothetical protein ACRD96_15640, partial [Bryobacteraceae bacterium]
MVKSGDAAGAKALLARAAQSSPNDATALREHAEFLDRFGDPGARAAYGKLLAATNGNGRAAVSRRLVALDLLAGDRGAAQKHLEVYRQAGGSGLTLGSAAAAAGAAHAITIPGPLRSFGRMAAISTDLGPEDVLGALARNVVTNGYQASHSNDALEQTEYLKLVHRYLSQARELEKLGGAERVIKVETCESASAGELMKILG